MIFVMQICDKIGISSVFFCLSFDFDVSPHESRRRYPCIPKSKKDTGFGEISGST